ncbi:MAG: hypothetical protein WC979_09080 [Candidatus Pacearchaeota archaeon]|jgi:predicted Na+-dependent transporter
MKNSKKKILKWIGGLALFLFVISGFILTWEFISEHAIWFFIISGIIVFIFVIIGLFTFRKVWRRFKKYWGIQ